MVFAFAVLVGCKAPAGARAPADVPDDIDAIEATLARNADDLQAAGILVAQRTDVPPAGDAFRDAEEETQAEPEAEPEGGEEAEEPVMEEAPPESAPSADASAPPEPSRRTARTRSFERRRGKRDEADRCQRICDLAEATCDLSDRICDLASRHPDEVRYDTACDRAEAQCDAAADACSGCAR
jgi:hypothetical protein